MLQQGGCYRRSIGDGSMKRRAFISAVTATPLVALPIDAAVNDEQAATDSLIAIRKHTGLSLDDLSDWFEGIPSDVLAHIASNALNARIVTWSKGQTYVTVHAFKAGEVFASRGDRNRLAEYCERQIRLRADKAEVARVLGYFTNSAKAYPTLMDLA